MNKREFKYKRIEKFAMQNVMRKMQEFCEGKIVVQIFYFFLHWPALYLVQVGAGLWILQSFHSAPLVPFILKGENCES